MFRRLHLPISIITPVLFYSAEHSFSSLRGPLRIGIVSFALCKTYLIRCHILYLKFSHLERKFSFRLCGLLLLSLFFPRTCGPQVPDSTAASDSALLKQIESQMQPGTTQPPPQQTRSGATMNPDIGVIGDFQWILYQSGARKMSTLISTRRNCSLAGCSRSSMPAPIFHHLVCQGSRDRQIRR